MTDAGNVIVLNAPNPEWGKSALEDRRLAALCAALDIDLFLSTFCTSAGSKVATLFVIDETDSLLSDRDSHLPVGTKGALRRCERLACRSWSMPDSDHCLEKELVQTLAKEMILAAQSQSDESQMRIRDTEERATVMLANNLRETALRKYQQAHDEKAQLSSVKPSLLYRVFRALCKPHRYINYLNKVFHFLALAFGIS